MMAKRKAVSDTVAQQAASPKNNKEMVLTVVAHPDGWETHLQSRCDCLACKSNFAHLFAELMIDMAEEAGTTAEEVMETVKLRRAPAASESRH